MSYPSVVVQGAPAVGPYSTRVDCPQCHATVLTNVNHKATTQTHMCAGLLCLFCCWLCVCIPYCTNSCRNTNHTCPKCKAFIGSYKS